MKLLGIERVESVSAVELAQRARNGDTAAFEELYRRHSPWILRMARGRGLGDAESEDAMHDAFMCVLAGLDDFDSTVGGFEPWIVVIARNVISSRVARQRTRRRFDDGEQGQLELESMIVDRKMQDGEVAATLATSRALLPRTQRQVIFLRFDVGLDTTDISTLLDRTPESVRQLQSRALRTLRRALNGVAAGTGTRAVNPMVLRPRTSLVLLARRFRYA